MGKLFGYARVSSAGQSLEIQEKALTDAGCITVFAEKVSGTSRNGRSELARIMAILRSGDTLVVTRLDRLARSMSDLLQITGELEEKGASLRCLEQPFDTSGPMGKLIRNLLGSIAEFETELRRERQAEGIAAAKGKGVYKGRVPTISREEVQRLKASGMQISTIAKQLKISRQSVYRVLDA
jgi:DNA invertase Pin-like site-specific DNA recombinase